ncbi:uncharacterized protein LOC113769332 [Coffea eugenioides]|uniref:uncharacterized protein LOC113769332 n=1 Tax=Coffea eugenioides TaxID=49369 RepID=UPI000F60DCDD|nr:uncharacterized protein LOC113769332 [Coffea eugenioides]
MKLKAVKQALRRWNKEVVGNVFDRIREDEEKVMTVECSLGERPTEEGQHQFIQAQGELKASLLQEANYWRQKACIRWLKEGDANSKLFHAQVKQMRARTYMHRMKDRNGVWIDESAKIEEMTIEYFADILLQSGQVQVDHSLLGVIPWVISEQDNMELQQFPTEEEVKIVVFQMNGDSSLGPDGFKGSFFTSCWDIVKGDVYRAVCDFFAGAELP